MLYICMLEVRIRVLISSIVTNICPFFVQFLHLLFDSRDFSVYTLGIILS